MTTVQTLQLLASFFGPIVAAMMVMVGWKRTHVDASKRDLENWRRTTLANAVTEMISEAEDVLYTEVDNDDKDNRRKRRLLLSSLEQKKSLVLMCDSGIIWDCCHSYIESVRKLMIAKSNNDIDTDYEHIADLTDENRRMQSYLVEQLPVSIKLHEAKPYDPKYAAVVRTERLSKNEIRWRKMIRKLDNATKSKKLRKPWTDQDEQKEIVLQ